MVEEERGGGGGTQFVHGRSRMTIDPRGGARGGVVKWRRARGGVGGGATSPSPAIDHHQQH